MAPAAHSVPTPTPTRIGPRSRTLQNVAASKTELPRETIVSHPQMVSLSQLKLTEWGL